MMAHVRRAPWKRTSPEINVCEAALKLPPTKFRVLSGQTLHQGTPSGDLSETRRGIQFLRPKEPAHVSRGSLLLKMELRSNPEMLCVVRNAVGELTAKLGFSEPDCRAVVRAVDEALTNIIRHAYLGNLEQPIDASFHRIDAPKDGQSGDALEIILEDNGVTANPEKMCGRALEDVRPGGLGLHFIRECMDTVEFTHSDGRNRLRLVKILHGQTSPKGS